MKKSTLLTALLTFLLCLVLAACAEDTTQAPASQPATTAPTMQATTVPTQALTVMPTPKPTPTPKPPPRPTVLLVKPTAQPTQALRPTPVPTQAPPKRPTPTPVPHCTGVNNNPWCYDFNPGKLIYVPPGTFCTYFHCITSFVEPDDPGDGYVVECADDLFSQSGGERGACSFHGGVLRALYAH